MLMNYLLLFQVCSMGRRKVMTQPTFTGFMKRARVEENSHNSIVCSNDEFAIGGENSNADGNLDLNLLAQEDSFHEQPTREESSQPQPSPTREESSQPQAMCDQVIYDQSHMPMLDLLAVGNGEKSLTVKERGFRDQWKLQFLWIRPITVNGLTRVKCCERFQVKGFLGKGEGCRNLQRGALNDHNKSTRHCYARTRWLSMNRQCKSIPQHVSSTIEGMKAKIITAMKFMYFIVLHCLPMSCYTSMCNFAKERDFGGLPGSKDYATYANAILRRKFVIAIIESNQVEEVRNSPCYSLLLDESTNRALESHLIVYLSYLDKGGLDQPKSLFLSLCNS